MSHPDELGRALDQPHDEARARRNWAAIEARRRPARTHRRALPWALTGAALFAAAALLVITREPPRGPLALLDGGVRGVDLVGPVVGFDDGSRVELHADARVELLENDGSQVRLWLHQGRTRFDIVPGGPRRWVIESGEVTVEVLGTAFVVERDADHIRVEVERGSVLVRGVEVPEGMRRLGARESIEVALHAREDREAALGERPDTASEEPPLDLTEPASDEAGAPAGDHDDRAATFGDERDDIEHHDTRSDIEHEGIERDDIEREGAEATAEDARRDDPLATADRLRAEGRIEEALEVLASVMDGGGPRRERALAAFTMGRVLLDRERRYSAAATAFERSIELGLSEPLVEDARARLTEARFAAGDHPGARAAAERYLTHHPSGRWRARVEEWAAE